MTIPSQPDLLDFFAAHAMTALMVKTPLFAAPPQATDKVNPLDNSSTPVSADDLLTVRSSIASSAYGMAYSMLKVREQVWATQPEEEKQTKDFDTIKSCLAEAIKEGMEVEVVAFALESMKNRPDQSISAAMVDALGEWVK